MLASDQTKQQAAASRRLDRGFRSGTWYMVQICDFYDVDLRFALFLPCFTPLFFYFFFFTEIKPAQRDLVSSCHLPEVTVTVSVDRSCSTCSFASVECVVLCELVECSPTVSSLRYLLQETSAPPQISVCRSRLFLQDHQAQEKALS